MENKAIKMNLYEVIFKRRSIRRFKQKSIPMSILKKLIKAGVYAASGGNQQPCEFIAITEPKKVSKLTEFSGWLAGAPEKGQKPTAFIAVLANTIIRKESYESDSAAACQNILLSAFAEGIGGCWIGSLKKKSIRELLNIPEYLKIYSLIALGYPDEKPQTEEIKRGDKTAPHREEKIGRLYVPKRNLEDILQINSYKKP